MITRLAHFPRCPRVPFCAVLVSLCLAAGHSLAGGPEHVNLDPQKMPYLVEALKDTRARDTNDSAFMLADLDGDGFYELVTSNGRNLLGEDTEDGEFKPHFQINARPNWRFNNVLGTHLAVSRDHNGDGVPELTSALVKDDLSAWALVTFDVVTQEVLAEVPLPLGEDRRADGTWDGTYFPVGEIADADGQGTPATLVLCSVQYDASGRGVLAIDPLSGRVLWRWSTGSNPERRSLLVADLEGDGREEILLFGTSPDNLGGQRINGISDDKSCVIVLSDRGELLWRQELGGMFQNGSVRVHDFNDDGRLEIVTFTTGGRIGDTNKLVIWDWASRERLAIQRQGARYMGLAILDGQRPGTHWLFAGSSDGYVTRYLYADGQLGQDQRRLLDHDHVEVTGMVDVLGDAQPEIIVDAHGQQLVVFDTDLDVLASHRVQPAASMAYPAVWHQADGRRMLAAGGSRGYVVLNFTERPLDLARVMQISGAVLAGLLALALAYLLGRSRGRKNASEPVPAAIAPRTADREVLFRLWRELDDVKHERFLEVNRGLRRLVWLLEAYAADFGSSEGLQERIGQLLEDFAETMRPRLFGILHLARSERFEPEATGRTTAALERLEGHLAGMDMARLTPEAVEASATLMKEDIEVIEEGFLELWRALRRYFTSDPVRMLQGMFLVREVEFQRLGVTTEIEGESALAGTGCLIDGSSLRLVLDNLVNNALRAMADAPERRLTVAADRRGRELVLSFTDTGRGIGPEMREQVFSGRTAALAGGTGLFRSRQTLERWGGEILLERSAPDQGTTFVVKLRSAGPSEMSGEQARAMTGEA